MADDLQKAEAIGRVVSRPSIHWHKEQDSEPLYEVEPLPLYVGQITAKVKEFLLVMVADYSVGSASDATIQFQLLRSGSPIHTYSSAFQLSWAFSATVLTTPDWDIEPGDVLQVSIAKSGSGVLLPSCLIRVITEP